MGAIFTGLRSNYLVLAYGLPLWVEKRRITVVQAIKQGRTVLKRQKVLIVDDIPTHRLFLLDALRNRYEVVGVGSAEEARDRIEKGRCDALIVSRATWLAGEEHITHLKKVAEVPLVVTVEKGCSVEDVLKVAELGADDCIEAPLVSERIVSVVERALRYNNLRIENDRLRRRLRDSERVSS